MKKLNFFLALLSLLSGIAGVQGQEIPDKEKSNSPAIVSLEGQQDKSMAMVTYIANEGFLIQTSNGKMLVDALFGGIKGRWCEQPDDSLLNLIINGQPSFDNIDVVLVSHYHVDHFNEKMVTEFMVKNPKTILFCPDQVNQLLKKNSSYPQFSERVRTIHYTQHKDTSFVTGDIQIRAMTMNHGAYLEKDTITGELKDLHKDVENIAYLIKTNGCTFFHGGDASIKAFENFKEAFHESEKVDFAFLDRVFMQPAGMKVISELIKPEKLIFMHIEPSRVEYYKNVVKDFPEIFIFSKPLESVVFQKHSF